jgi:3-oxoacyl-[acyl-carrier-protein] synthase II
MRVFVTGVGIASPLALGARATMSRLMAGHSAFARVSLFDVGEQRTQVAAEVRELEPPPSVEPLWSRTDLMALTAAREALAEAALDALPCDLIVSGTTGGMLETEQLLGEMWRNPERREPQRAMLTHPLSATSDRLQEALGPFRRVRTLCSACSSGANAVALGSEWIRAGASERVLVGGADGLCRLTFTGFNALAAVTSDVCRPFDRRRSGLGLGEGAGFLMLESEASLLRRGFAPIAEVAGWAAGCEAHHISHPEPTGSRAAELIRRALHSAGLAPGDIDYINAHGTGTTLNDAMEAQALHRALAKEAQRIPVSSVKGQIGHTLGAAGAIEAVITVLAIANGDVPPTGGLEQPDPACALAHVIGKGRKATVRAAISNSFGFGGSDTVLVFTRARGSAPRAPLTSPPLVITGASTLGPRGLLSAPASLAYLESAATGARMIPSASVATLDLARARRMDRAARLLTVAVQAALGDDDGRASQPSDTLANIDGAGHSLRLTGLVAGSAYGTVDASAEFMRRIFEKGPRLASPAVFPNLVPSSPAGHSAIYLKLHGPVFAVADLDISSESAFASACELVAAGHAQAMVAASVEEASDLTEQVLGPVCSASDAWVGARSEGASALVVESETQAHSLGRRALAKVVRVSTGRGSLGRQLAEMPAPRGRSARLIMARRQLALERALDDSAWRDVIRFEVAPGSGHHEGVGGFALVCAVGSLDEALCDEVLVIGQSPDRYALVLLRRP